MDHGHKSATDHQNLSSAKALKANKLFHENRLNGAMQNNVYIASTSKRGKYFNCKNLKTLFL